MELETLIDIKREGKIKLEGGSGCPVSFVVLKHGVDFKIWVDDNFDRPYHPNAVQQFLRANDLSEVIVCGGGRIYGVLGIKKSVMRLFGDSSNYGPFNLKEVQKIAKKYERSNLKINVTEGDGWGVDPDNSYRETLVRK